jgi:hypothetical protein
VSHGTSDELFGNLVILNLKEGTEVKHFTTVRLDLDRGILSV